MHKPIIDEATWQLTKNKLENKKLNHSIDMSRQPKYLFSKLLVCPSCGGKMSASMMKRKNAKGETVHDLYYKCRLANSGGKCDFNLIKEEYIAPQIIELFLFYYKYYLERSIEDIIIDSLLSNEHSLEETDNIIIGLENEKEMIQARINQAYTDYSEGLLPKDNYIQVRENLVKKINELEGQINKINVNVKRKTVTKNEMQIFIDKISQYNNVEEYFNLMDMEGKMELLSKYIIRIEVNKLKGHNGKNSVALSKIALNKDLIYPASIIKKRKQEVFTNNIPLYEKFKFILNELKTKLNLQVKGNAIYPDVKQLWDLEDNSSFDIQYFDVDTGEQYPSRVEFQQQWTDKMLVGLEEMRERQKKMTIEELDKEINQTSEVVSDEITGEKMQIGFNLILIGIMRTFIVMMKKAGINSPLSFCFSR